MDDRSNNTQGGYRSRSFESMFTGIKGFDPDCDETLYDSEEAAKPLTNSLGSSMSAEQMAKLAALSAALKSEPVEEAAPAPATPQAATPATASEAAPAGSGPAGSKPSPTDSTQVHAEVPMSAASPTTTPAATASPKEQSKSIAAAATAAPATSASPTTTLASAATPAKPQLMFYEEPKARLTAEDVSQIITAPQRYRAAEQKKTPILTPAQQDAIDLAMAERYTAIKGAVGSGKTLLATKIGKLLDAQEAVWAQQQSTAPQEPVIIACYTNALAKYIETQVPETMRVQTVHTLLKDFIEANGQPAVEFSASKIDRLEWIAGHYAKNALSAEYIDAQFGVLFGRGIDNLADYLKLVCPQSVRGGEGGESPNQAAFETIFCLFTKYQDELAQAGLTDFDDIGNVVLRYCATEHMKPIASHLIVDEIQDLKLTQIQALGAVSADKLVVIGDRSQAIYKTDFSWAAFDNAVWHSITLDENFRSTRQIFDIANFILEYNRFDNADIDADADDDQQFCVAYKTGPRPQIFFTNGEESALINIYVKVIEILASEETANDTICIGYRHRAYVEGIIDKLSDMLYEKGIMCGDSRTAAYYQVAVLSMHAMKGLEFDHVILIGLDEDCYGGGASGSGSGGGCGADSPDNISNGDTEAEPTDIERRLLYIAMTRALKTVSLYSHTANPLSFIGEIPPRKFLPVVWNSTAFENTYENHLKRVSAERLSLQSQLEHELGNSASLKAQMEEIRNTHDKSDAEKMQLITRLADELDKSIRREETLQWRLDVNEQYEKATRKQLDVQSSPTVTTEFNFKPNAKILIYGGSGGLSDKDIRSTFLAHGLKESDYEIVEYERVTNFDLRKLMDTQKYTDIIASAAPHSGKGMANCGNTIRFLEYNQDRLPRLYITRNEDNSLSNLTKNHLDKALDQSALYAYRVIQGNCS